MQMKRVAAAVFLLLLLAGCGSSYTDTTRSAVSSMRDTLQHYNGSHPTSLAATGSACSSAYDDLGAHASDLTKGSPPSRYRKVVADLRSAYQSARQGFHDCARAASSNNYPLMASAQSEIAAANTAISRARAADR